MLTPDQLEAESITPALTDPQVANIMLLVKQFPAYIYNLGLFPGLPELLVEEQATPTIKTQVCKAVLTALNELPEVVVESQGQTEAPSHFTTNENWNALALDILNAFYSTPAGLVSHQSFALTQRKLETLLLTEDYDATIRQSLTKR